MNNPTKEYGICCICGKCGILTKSDIFPKSIIKEIPKENRNFSIKDNLDYLECKKCNNSLGSLVDADFKNLLDYLSQKEKTKLKNNPNYTGIYLALLHSVCLMSYKENKNNSYKKYLSSLLKDIVKIRKRKKVFKRPSLIERPNEKFTSISFLINDDIHPLFGGVFEVKKDVNNIKGIFSILVVFIYPDNNKKGYYQTIHFLKDNNKNENKFYEFLENKVKTIFPELKFSPPFPEC